LLESQVIGMLVIPLSACPYSPTAMARLPRSISVMTQAVGRRYVRHVNQTCRRTGTLFDGRFRASLVQSERSWQRAVSDRDCRHARASRACRTGPATAQGTGHAGVKFNLTPF
jgi:hypothetical protein